MSIADTGRFWEILVIPVLQILEDSGKYWLYQYCRYWKILKNTGYTSIADTGRLGTKRNVLVYWFFLFCLCVCYERTDSV
jgi:hypothetical protein